MPWGPGPVFRYECITSARRWQNYAARSLSVIMLLLGMATIAWANVGLLRGNSVRRHAQLGEYYYDALVGIELSLVMLAAPAATAGAICRDRARGALTHILVTDLSDSEIVLGKLTARLLPVLGVVACAWPVLAISTLLGGIDPLKLTMALGLIVVVAVLGCSLSLALSVWARKPYDVIIAVYTLWAVILLAYPVMWMLATLRLLIGPPRWLLMANPFYLAIASYSASGGVERADFGNFVAVSLGASATLVLAAVWSVRRATSRASDGGKSTKRHAMLGRLTRWLRGPSLDTSPVLWREWHRARPSRWLTIIGVFLWVITIAACVNSALTIWNHGALATKATAPAMILGLAAETLLIVFGLLVLSAAAPLSVSEERQHSGLDLLVVTPLSTRSIMLAKWLGAFRFVPLLAIGPGVDMLAWAAAHDDGQSVRFGLFRVGLMLTTILVHGALVTSVGLALATWLERQSRAIALSVSAFVLVAIAWPIWAYAAGPDGYAQCLSALSPVCAVVLLADQAMVSEQVWSFHLWLTFWDATVAYAAGGLLLLTIRSFDGCFGRIPDQRRRSTFFADVVAVAAGGIAIASVAFAIAGVAVAFPALAKATWVNIFGPV
jgi:ABC-type transport system involved in multi-copper enzyme maturation permease subunit